MPFEILSARLHCGPNHDLQEVYGIRPRNAEQCFAMDALTNQTILLVTITGKAGTDKRLSALAAALEKS